MKKRKRKMEHLKALKQLPIKAPFLLLLTLSVHYSIIANCSPINFDEDSYQHLLNASSVRANETHSSSISSGNNSRGAYEFNSLELEDPLLAVETSRYLTIGKPPANSAPYETNNSIQTSNVSKLLPFGRQQHNNLNSQQLKLTPLNSYPPPLTSWPNFYLPPPPGRPVISLAPAVNQEREQNLTLNEAQELEYNPSNETSREFPSLINNSSLSGLEEDEFEKKLANGNYQRTNSSAMSWAQLLRQATESNVMESLTVTNRSMVSLLCDTHDMLIRLKFKKPFRGLVMTNLDRHKSCRLIGDGSHYYEMRISLKENECGTRQEMPRLFINNIQIQFHQALDSIDDEIKTIICSYPIRPLAPPPPALPANVSERIVKDPADSSLELAPAKLVHYEPIVLISGLLLVSLILLALTTSAYMFTKRTRGLRKLNSPSSNSGFGSRLYVNPPAQRANLLLAPPLIGFEHKKNKVVPFKSFNYRSAPAVSSSAKKEPETRRRTYSNNKQPQINDLIEEKRVAPKRTIVSLNPNDSSDSLGASRLNDQSSVTTIEIPYSTSTNKTAPPAVLIPIELNQSRGTTTNVNVTKQRDVDVKDNAKSSERESLDEMSDPVMMVKKIRKSKVIERTDTTYDGGFRKAPRESTPLKVNRFADQKRDPKKRLEDIVKLFNEENCRSKYRAKIVAIMDEKERKVASDLLKNDELFRSLIVDSISKESFKKIRNIHVYASKFKPTTWDLLQEILLDPKALEGNENLSQRKITRQQTSSEQLEEIVEKSSQDHLDSLSSASASASAGNLAEEAKGPESEGSKESIIRVSQFNSTKTTQQGGLTGTLININSITNFTDSRDFSFFTRSSIEHSRMNHKDAEDDSLPYVDERVAEYEYAKLAADGTANRK